jgi:hypothetical protein
MDLSKIWNLDKIMYKEKYPALFTLAVFFFAYGIGLSTAKHDPANISNYGWGAVIAAGLTLIVLYYHSVKEWREKKKIVVK